MIKINMDILAQAYRFRLMHVQKERLDVSVVPTNRERANNSVDSRQMVQNEQQQNLRNT